MADVRVTGSGRERSEMADGSWMLWTAAGVGGIWLAVVLISLFAPDMVSGSEHSAHEADAAVVGDVRRGTE